MFAMMIKNIVVRTVVSTLKAGLLCFLMSLPAHSEELVWMTDVQQAKSEAADNDRVLLLFFTGSDWCGWCQKLEMEVFDSSIFAQYAKDQLVPVKLDFPYGDGKISPEQLEHNEKWRDVYPVEGYPTVYLVSPEGEAFSKLGYREGGAEFYVGLLESAIENRAKRDKYLKQAKASAGMIKLEYLDAMLSLPDMIVNNRDELIVYIAENAEPNTDLSQKYRVKASEVNLAAALDQISKCSASQHVKLNKLYQLVGQYPLVTDGDSLYPLVTKIERLSSVTGRQQEFSVFIDKLISDEKYDVSFRQARAMTRLMTKAAEMDLEDALAEFERVVAMAKGTRVDMMQSKIMADLKSRCKKGE